MVLGVTAVGQSVVQYRPVDLGRPDFIGCRAYAVDVLIN